jgi:hypothetical protein
MVSIMEINIFCWWPCVDVCWAFTEKVEKRKIVISKACDLQRFGRFIIDDFSQN